MTTNKEEAEQETSELQDTIWELNDLYFDRKYGMAVYENNGMICPRCNNKWSHTAMTSTYGCFKQLGDFTCVNAVEKWPIEFGGYIYTGNIVNGPTDQLCQVSTWFPWDITEEQLKMYLVFS